MADVLVTVDSGYGATEAVATVVATALAEKNLTVDLQSHRESTVLYGYETIFIGSPIRFGQCTPQTKRLLKRLKKDSHALSRTKVICFFTCMSLTGKGHEPPFPVFIDPSLTTCNTPSPRLGFMKNNHTLGYYLDHFLRLLPETNMVDIAFFKGSLDWPRLHPVHKLVMRLAMFALPEIQTGNFINPEIIRMWANRMAHHIERPGPINGHANNRL